MNILKNTIITCVLAIFLSYISCGIINLRQVKAEKGIIKKAIAAFPKSKSSKIYCSVMLVYMIALSIVITNLYSDNICEYAKSVALASLMWPMAQIDHKFMRIPNKLIVLGLIYRYYIFVFELIYYRDGLLSTVISELIGALAIFIVLMLISLIIKNGIGMGDVKFLMLMGLMLGMYRLAATVFVIMIITFFVSLYKLIIKKVDKKSEFAFGPLIAIGSAISFIIFGN